MPWSSQTLTSKRPSTKYSLMIAAVLNGESPVPTLLRQACYNLEELEGCPSAKDQAPEVPIQHMRTPLAKPPL